MALRQKSELLPPVCRFRWSMFLIFICQFENVVDHWLKQNDKCYDSLHSRQPFQSSEFTNKAQGWLCRHTEVLSLVLASSLFMPSCPTVHDKRRQQTETAEKSMEAGWFEFQFICINEAQSYEATLLGRADIPPSLVTQDSSSHIPSACGGLSVWIFM